MAERHADVEWRDGGTPVSTRFDDPYFSLNNGLEETRHVFLKGNELPARFRPGFHIAELGFGTGLNMLAAWALWQDADIEGELTFTSFERFPMSVADTELALRAFPQLEHLSEQFLEALRLAPTHIQLPGLDARIILGDAGRTLAAWSGVADAWFLDGFSPARNPDMWTASLLRQVALHTRSGGSFATYTAAGEVRRGLAAAGFIVERRPGFGRKRHMSAGRLEHARDGQ